MSQMKEVAAERDREIVAARKLTADSALVAAEAGTAAAGEEPNAA